MDVFLIPTTTSERYELYYEAPDEEIVEDDTENGFIERTLCRWPWLHRKVHGWKASFNDSLKEAEEWRHRRHEEQPVPQGFLARMRRKVMSFIVERIAEQRLLWHMRHAEQICARIPADMSEAEGAEIIRTMLKKDSAHHFRWIFIDAALLTSTAPLMVIPGPNVPGFYFFFQTVGHFLSWRGAKQGLNCGEWTYKPSDDLAELRSAMTMAAPERHRRFRELAERLRLEHLETFCEEVAAPTV